MWFSYLLRCADNTIYAGMTNDLEKRVVAHNAGKGGAYTRSRRPVRLIFFQRHRTQSKAMRTEATFKNLSRIQKEAMVLTWTAKNTDDTR